MKIAHLILAHSEPNQLERLIKRLSHKDAYFFVHIDGKARLESFNFLTKIARVLFVSERVRVHWGAYSIVQATVNGFKEIIKSGIKIDYVNLLSGSDYPLQSADTIHEFFTRNKGKDFLEYQSVHEEWVEAIPRITEYHLTNYFFPGKYLVQKIINKVAPKREMPDKLVAVGRSQWMTVTYESVEYIVKYLESHHEVSRFFKLTWAPDEMIFQTILFNSILKDNLINNNLRHIDWSAGKASPKTLDTDDFETLMNSKALFARKFDHKQSEILDLIDERISGAI